ncbi:NucA/NucB deoxyribonuclease domain-containing protein [Streptomyces sp. NPDC099050]|uniref:NucA/NucB deoxyribonuclease domain-containing protein n=1 Tax=Streptomyces sp. NPDC099050 TaxID=3366100 RepID=UPI0037F581F7
MTEERRFKSRTYLLAVLAAALVLPLAGPAAAAGTVPQLHARTFMSAPGAPVPSLADLKRGDGASTIASGEANGDAATTPLEVVGPAAAYGIKSSTPAALDASGPAGSGSGASPLAVSYPEPARTLTLAECKAKLVGAERFYMKSRFAVCSGLKVTTVWEKQSGAVGTSTFTVYVRGTVPREVDRTMYFDYDVTDFKAVGSTGASGLKIGLKGVIPQDWPASATPVVSKTLPVTKTWLEMRSQPHYTHTVRYAPGQGSGTGAADAVFAVYQPEVTSTLPAGWVGEKSKTGKPFMFAPRWDSAKYLRNSTGGAVPANRGGAAFSLIATLNYSSQPGAPEQAVAQHIKKAFTSPSTTKPRNAAKNVPGDTLQDPLHRLALDTKRQQRNRAVAVAACKAGWGPNYAAGGKECDEFPFASTHEGSAVTEFDPDAAPYNYSAMPVPATQNNAAGILLKGFYNANRIIDGLEDGFIVKIS